MKLQNSNGKLDETLIRHMLKCQN